MNKDKLLGLSLCIPSYNGKQKLARLLNSIEQVIEHSNQSKYKLEIVIVLDGSTDDSIDYLEEVSENYPVAIRVKWQPNRGLAAARNALISIAAYSKIWLVDDDMVVSIDAIRFHSEWENRNVDVYFGPCRVNSAIGHVNNYYAERWQRLSLSRQPLDPMDVTFANTSFHKSSIANHRFDEQFIGYGLEDVDFAARLLTDGITIAFEPSAHIVHFNTRSQKEHLKLLRQEGYNRILFARKHPEYSNKIVDLQKTKIDPVLVYLVNTRRSQSLYFLAVVFNIVSQFSPSYELGRKCNDYAAVCALRSGIAGFKNK